MARWLVGLMLISSTGFSVVARAEASILTLLAVQRDITPQVLMLQVEKDYPGTISEFEIDIEKGELVYELSVIDSQAETITEFEFRAKDGQLMKQLVNRLELNNNDEVHAIQLMEDKSLTFSDLVGKAMPDDKAYILEAQLDHDLGISYLELKVIDANGKHKHAIDIKTLRPLPLLKWDY